MKKMSIFELVSVVEQALLGQKPLIQVFSLLGPFEDLYLCQVLQQNRAIIIHSFRENIFFKYVESFFCISVICQF